MMRYIHGKDWDAKLLEVLVAERMKPNINPGQGIFQGFSFNNNNNNNKFIFPSDMH